MRILIRTGLPLLFFSGILLLPAFAQEPAPKQIQGGVLNGKATSLPKPAFPAAARAVGASGAVTVQVLIDEEGNVVSATAVSGHPLLRAVAVEAARGARFSPTLLQGVPVKVAGVITYNFVGPLQMARLAFVIEHARRTATFGVYTQPDSLAYQLPAEWTAEREILNSLTFEEEPKVAKVEEPKIEISVAKPPPDVAAPRDTNRYTIKGDINYSAAGPTYATRKLDAKSIGAIQNLSNLVEGRASVNASASWAYEFGRLLGVFVAEIDDQTKFQSNLSALESQVNRAPTGAVEYSLRQATEFMEFAKKEGPSADARQSVVSKAEALSNLRY